MAWFYLFTAGILEIVWAFAMKKSAGFTLLVPSIVTLVGMVASFGLLALAMRSLPLGTAYTVWTGIGAVGTALAGIILFGESASALRLALLAVLVCTRRRCSLSPSTSSGTCAA